MYKGRDNKLSLSTWYFWELAALIYSITQKISEGEV